MCTFLPSIVKQAKMLNPRTLKNTFILIFWKKHKAETRYFEYLANMNPRPNLAHFALCSTPSPWRRDRNTKENRRTLTLKLNRQKMNALCNLTNTCRQFYLFLKLFQSIEPARHVFYANQSAGTKSSKNSNQKEKAVNFA